MSIDAWITNTRTKACNTAWFVYYNSSPSAIGTIIAGGGTNGAPFISVPANTLTPTKFTVTGTLTVPTFVSNDQLELQIKRNDNAGIHAHVFPHELLETRAFRFHSIKASRQCCDIVIS